MPLYKEWSPNDHSLAAIWHIGETESFYSERTGLNSQIKHPRRRIEHLAGRYLLQHLKEDFPLLHIAPDIHDKPRLPENQYFFSISHSHPYVAAIISDKEECGMDIQVWKDNIGDIAHMFLSDAELALFGKDGQFLTLAWAAKEAAYKWYGRRGADFIRDLRIRGWEVFQDFAAKSQANEFGMEVSSRVDMSCFDLPLSIETVLHKDFACAITVQQR